MKEILNYIDNKKSDFSLLPFFQHLRDSNISAKRKLAFAPFASTFIMSFSDINKFVLRDEPPCNELQAKINQHTYEDDHHWKWFLDDIKNLNFDQNISFSNTLKFLWDENAYAGRKLVNEIYRHSYQQNPILKLVIIEVLEATGNVMFSNVQPIAESLRKESGCSFIYFGSHHLAVETGHTTGIDDVSTFLEGLTISENHKTMAFQIIDDLFKAFSDFTNELLNLSLHINERSNVAKSLFCKTFDYLIIGAGPAGLQLGYFLEKSNRDYKILEAGNAPGTFFKENPRHRKLISINKRHTGYDDPEINLRWDWNSLLSDSEEMLFKHYSKKYFPDADSFVDYLGDFAQHFDLNIDYGVKIRRVTKDKLFTVIDHNGKEYSCKHLIVATGCSKLYVPDIPGIELAEKYTNVSINPDDFENQRVLVIGKGNSAFETADNLIDTASMIHVCSPNPISMAWKTKYVGHLRAVNNNFLDTYQLKSQNLILNAHIDNIKQDRNGKFTVSVSYTHANGELEDLEYDRIIVCTGFRFDDSLFDDSCKPKLTINNRFPDQTSSWESTNVQDLFFAGILMHMRDFKEKQSGFIHGFRYNIKALHQMLESRFHKESWQHQDLKLDSNVITNLILDRVNLSSALWQQTGFLCDVILVSEIDQKGKYFQEVPKDYILDSEFGKHDHYYTISLEFGHEYINAFPDPFAIERVHKDDVNNAEQSPSLHPIIRRYSQGNLIAEHHIIEDIASEWKEEVHVQPLLQFMTEQLAQPQPIGSHLLQAGLLTSEQLDAALSEQEMQASVRLGEVIQNHGWVKERTIQFMVDRVNKNVEDSQALAAYAQLGSYLVEAGLITQTQVDQALEEQQTSNKSIGEILVSHGWVTSQTIEYMMKYVTITEPSSEPEVAILN